MPNLANVPPLDGPANRYTPTPGFDVGFGASTHPYMRFQTHQQQQAFLNQQRSHVLAGFDHAALLHPGNGYADPTQPFPTMIGASPFLGPAGQLLGQNASLQNPAFTSPPFPSTAVFPYANAPMPSNSWMNNVSEELSTAQHRAHRSKPVPPSDEMILLPPHPNSQASDALPAMTAIMAPTNGKGHRNASGKAKSTGRAAAKRSKGDGAPDPTSTRRGHGALLPEDEDSIFLSNTSATSIPSGAMLTGRSALVAKSREIAAGDDDDILADSPALMDTDAITAAAKNAIQRSFANAFIKVRGQRMSVLGLKTESSLLHLEHQPTEHQVKDFNIIPTPVIKIKANARTCDFVAAHLYCDESMHLDDPIFLAALNAKLITNSELAFINLRVTKEMLKGRTKGFSFVISFTYYSDGQELDTIYTTPFWLFSNVNQEGFPKSERDSYLRPQWRDSTAAFSTKRKK